MKGRWVILRPSKKSIRTDAELLGGLMVREISASSELKMCDGELAELRRKARVFSARSEVVNGVTKGFGRSRERHGVLQ